MLQTGSGMGAELIVNRCGEPRVLIQRGLVLQEILVPGIILQLSSD